MKFPGKQCAGEPQALFEAEGAGVIQSFTLHEGALCNDRVLIYPVAHDQREEQGTSQGFTVFSKRIERGENLLSVLSRDDFR